MYEGQEVSEIDVPWIAGWLARVAFYDSIVVLAKRRRFTPAHEIS